MDHDEMRRAIEGAIDVPPALVFQAKAHLVRQPTGQARQMIDAFIAEMDATLVQPVVIHPSVDEQAVVARVARWLSCQAAAREAAWALIGSGALVPRSERMEQPYFRIGWTTVIPGSGGSTSSWDFGPAIPVPERLSPSSGGVSHLTDGDLFLAELGLPGLDEGVVESLHAATACFRHDLFLPAQVMLGRAAEGCWLLLAEALIAAALDETAARKLQHDLDRWVSFARLPEQVEAIYATAAYQTVRKSSGVSLDALRAARVWTEVLREARNAVHPASEAPLPATWETTAALLMGAGPHLRRLWAATEMARIAPPVGQPRPEPRLPRRAKVDAE